MSNVSDTAYKLCVCLLVATLDFLRIIVPPLSRLRSGEGSAQISYDCILESRGELFGIRFQPTWSKKAFIVKTLFLMALLCSSALADFSSDAYPTSVSILPELISAAERSERDFLTPHVDVNNGHPMAYYVRSASYIGQCQAPFGLVHILAINYIRSASKDSRNLPRGHPFVLFFDKSLKLQSSWRVNFDSSDLSLREGNKLYFGDELVFDYAVLPKPSKLPGEADAEPHAFIDGEVFTIPTWSSTATTTGRPMSIATLFLFAAAILYLIKPHFFRPGSRKSTRSG